MEQGDQLKMAEILKQLLIFLKIKTPFFCFHDRDVFKEGKNYKESQKFSKIVDLMEKKLNHHFQNYLGNCQCFFT